MLDKAQLLQQQIDGALRGILFQGETAAVFKSLAATEGQEFQYDPDDRKRGTGTPIKTEIEYTGLDQPITEADRFARAMELLEIARARMALANAANSPEENPNPSARLPQSGGLMP